MDESYPLPRCDNGGGDARARTHARTLPGVATTVSRGELAAPRGGATGG